MDCLPGAESQFTSPFSRTRGDVTGWLYVPALMASWLMAVDRVGRETGSYCYILVSTRNDENGETTNNLWYAIHSICCTQCILSSVNACTRWELMITAGRDIDEWLNFVFCNDGSGQERERLGMKMRMMWSIRVNVRNQQFHFPDWVGMTLYYSDYVPNWKSYLRNQEWFIDTHPNVPLIHSFSWWFAPSPLISPCPQLYTHLWTRCSVIPLNLPMPWLRVSTKYGIHRVMHTPHTASFQHQLSVAPSRSLTSQRTMVYTILFIPTMSNWPMNTVWASIGHASRSTVSRFAVVRLIAFRSITSRSITSKYSSILAQSWSQGESPNWLDSGLHVDLWVYTILASKYISKFNRSSSESVLRNTHIYCLRVNLQTRMIADCKFAQWWSPSESAISLNPGIQVHHQGATVAAWWYCGNGGGQTAREYIFVRPLKYIDIIPFQFHHVI